MTDSNYAIIFDMDGVIVDSEVHWKKVGEDYVAKIIPGWRIQDQQKILGLSLVDIYRIYVEDYGLKMSYQELLEFYEDIARKVYQEKSNIISEADQVIEKLFYKNIPLALASSSPHCWISLVTERFKIGDFFKVVASSEDVSGVGKPAPDIYNFTLKKLETSPQKTFAVEDTKRGIQSAKAAGIKCVGLSNGFNHVQDLSSADLIINDLAELLDVNFIQQLFQSSTKSEN